MSVSKPTPKISINGFVNNLYKRYIEASRKEEQKRKIEEVISQLDIELGGTWIYDPKKACWEYIAMLPGRLEFKIREMWKYMFKNYEFVSAGIHVTTCEVEGQSFENEITGKYIAVETDDGYLNYVKVTEVDGVHVYLVVSDRRIEEDDP